MSVNIGAARRKINKLHNIAKRGPTHTATSSLIFDQFGGWELCLLQKQIVRLYNGICLDSRAGFCNGFHGPWWTWVQTVCTYHWGDCIFGQNRWHTRKSVHFGELLLSTGAAMRDTLQFNFYAHTLWLCFCINKKQILFVFCQCDQIEKFTNFLKVICRLQCGPSLEN